MGMAASQARFLGITARKTNTEYEGQQINQERTALANQSANLYNQMLGLDVPTPPSKSDAKYTKTVYAFTDDTGATATIQSITNNPDSKTSDIWPKVVSYTTSAEALKSRRASLSTAATVNTETTDGSKLYKNYIKVGSAEQAQVSKITYDKSAGTRDTSAQTNIYNTLYAKYFTDHSIDPTTATDAEKKAATESATAGTSNLYKYKDASGNWSYVNMPETFDSEGKATVQEYNASGVASGSTSTMVRSGSGTSADPYTYSIGSNELSKIATDATGTIQLSGSSDVGELGSIDLANIAKLQETYAALQSQDTFYKYTISGVNYYIPASDVTGDFNGKDFDVNQANDPYGYYVSSETESVNKEYPAKVTYDTSGRLQSIILKEGENSLTFDVSVNSVTDEDKYENDFNQYKYEMAEYEKTIEDINAQTEAIQAQDRTLELRLKQLDTEQEALTQEMDAIKKVIDKNVETTFKTFA